MRLDTLHEMATPKMRERHLDGALGKPGAVGEIGKAHRHATRPRARTLRGKEEIHEERGGRAIVIHEIAQQDVRDISIHFEGGGHAMAVDAIATASMLVARHELS